VLLPHVIKQLSNTFFSVQSESEMRFRTELQGHICGVLMNLTIVLKEKVLQQASQMMDESLKVLFAYQQVKKSQQVLQEEALLLIIALIRVLGVNFEIFMQAFAPFLQVGLQNVEDTSTCHMSIIAVGDLCSALGKNIAPYSDAIIQLLYANLQKPNVDLKIKVATVACFGDMALAITDAFEKHLPGVVNIMEQAANIRFKDRLANDEEWKENVHSLREGVLEGYASIVNGLKGTNKLDSFKPYVMGIISFVKNIIEDPPVSGVVLKAALSVVGDLIIVFQRELMAHLVLHDLQFLTKLVEYASRFPDDTVVERAKWLGSLIQRNGLPTPH